MSDKHEKLELTLSTSDKQGTILAPGEHIGYTEKILLHIEHDFVLTNIHFSLNAGEHGLVLASEAFHEALVNGVSQIGFDAGLPLSTLGRDGFIGGLVRGIGLEEGDDLELALMWTVTNESDEPIANDTQIVAHLQGIKLDYDDYTVEELNELVGGIMYERSGDEQDTCAKCAAKVPLLADRMREYMDAITSVRGLALMKGMLTRQEFDALIVEATKANSGDANNMFQRIGVVFRISRYYQRLQPIIFETATTLIERLMAEVEEQINIDADDMGLPCVDKLKKHYVPRADEDSSDEGLLDPSIDAEFEDGDEA